MRTPNVFDKTFQVRLFLKEMDSILNNCYRPCTSLPVILVNTSYEFHFYFQTNIFIQYSFILSFSVALMRKLESPSFNRGYNHNQPVATKKLRDKIRRRALEQGRTQICRQVRLAFRQKITTLNDRTGHDNTKINRNKHHKQRFLYNRT